MLFRSVANGTREVEFWLRIPQSCLGGQHACDLIQYGHGLLGTGSEVCAGWAADNADERHAIYFSSNMIGMASEDGPTVIQILQNLNLFPALPERVSAGVVEHVVLQRAMRKQLPKLDWLVKNGVKLSGQVYWSGNSQGGIYGQTVLALSDDVTREMAGHAEALRELGAELLIAGCTEVPLVLEDDDVRLKLIDPGDLLARQIGRAHV